MLRKGKTWDVRCPKKLARMFPQAERHGYYYKVTRRQAQQICAALSKEYGVCVPVVAAYNPPRPNNGRCCWDGKNSSIEIHGRAHLKSVFHEWYHHLDFSTRGKYRSDDRQGGPSSLAWQFADRLFDALRST